MCLVTTRHKEYHKFSRITDIDNNTSVIAQMQDGFIKGDRTKHINSKFFYIQDLMRDKEINLVWSSSENAADLSTKPVSSAIHRKLSPPKQERSRNGLNRTTERVRKRKRQETRRCRMDGFPVPSQIVDSYSCPPLGFFPRGFSCGKV